MALAGAVGAAVLLGGVVAGLADARDAVAAGVIGSAARALRCTSGGFARHLGAADALGGGDLEGRGEVIDVELEEGHVLDLRVLGQEAMSPLGLHHPRQQELQQLPRQVLHWSWIGDHRGPLPAPQSQTDS